MKVEMEPYSALCSLRVFKINDIEADYNDFGEKEDINPTAAEPYGCGDMEFLPKAATQEVLDKYNITTDEYNEICKRLDCLSFGNCGWCV